MKNYNKNVDPVEPTITPAVVVEEDGGTNPPIGDRPPNP